jgi:hypothetical protein
MSIAFIQRWFTLSIKVQLIRSMTPFCDGVYDCVNCRFIPTSLQNNTYWLFTFFFHDLWIIIFSIALNFRKNFEKFEFWNNFIFCHKIDPNFARKNINKGHEIKGFCKWSYNKWVANVKMYKLKNSRVEQIILWWNLSWSCFPSW